METKRIVFDLLNEQIYKLNQQVSHYARVPHELMHPLGERERGRDRERER